MPLKQGRAEPSQTGVDLLQLCMELGWLKSPADLRCVSSVCKGLNNIIKPQVTEVNIPVSALIDMQQRMAWRRTTNPATRHAGNKQQQQQQQQHAAANGSFCEAAAPAGRDAVHSCTTNGAAAAEAGSSSSIPTSLQDFVTSRLPKLGGICLYYNNIVPSHVMASQLQQLAALPQLTSLELRDSCSWALPCPGLSNISCLTQLQQLQVLVQSPGMPIAASQGLGFPPVATSWQGHINKRLSHVQSLTQLRHLQLRFICGERGYFMSPTLLSVASCLSQLTYLDLGYVEVQPAGLASVARLRQLECLILYGSLSALAAQDYTCLSNLRSLRRLEMFHDWPPAQDDIAELETHTLDQEQEQQLVASLHCLTQLSWLNLPMSGKSTAMLPLLQHLPALKQLYLQSIERHQMELPMASFASTASRLKVLQIDNVRLTAQGLSCIAGLTQLQQLTLFNLLLDLDLGSHQCLTQLWKLSQLQQLCFDSLVSDGPANTAVLDNTVLTTLAQHWPVLQSLHVSYAALPEAADMRLCCFTAFKALANISLYCFQQLGMQQQDVVLDAGKLPPGLQSLCLSTVTVHNAALLPQSLEQMWLTDVPTPDLNPNKTLAAILADRLPQLQTLVLRNGGPGGPPPVGTADLAKIAVGCPRLECLGISLPEMLPESVDLRVLGPLTGLRQLLLDYCCDDNAAAAAAAVAAAAVVPPAVAAEAAPAAAQELGGNVDAAVGGGQEAGDVQQQQQQGGEEGNAAAAAAGAGENQEAGDAQQQQEQQQQVQDGEEGNAVPAAAAAPAGEDVANQQQQQQQQPPAMPAALPLHAEHQQLLQQLHDQVMAAAVHAAPLQQVQAWLQQAQQHLAAAQIGQAANNHQQLQQQLDNGAGALAAAAAAAGAGGGGGGGGQLQQLMLPPIQLPPPPLPWHLAAGNPMAPAAAAAGPAAGAAAAAQQNQQGFAVAVGPAGEQGFPAAMQGLAGPEGLAVAQQVVQGQQMPEFDVQEVVQQLSDLGQHMTKLRGLWLSDNVLTGVGAGLQQLLQQSMPYVTVRPAANDWFWGTNFPMGSCLNAENPMEWWKFTSWTIL